MMIKKRIYILALFLLFCGNGMAQYWDNQQWFAPSLKYSLSKELKLEFEQGFRFSEFSQINTSYSDFGLSYKINKHFKIAGGYRHIYRGTWNDPDNIDDRFYVDGSTEDKNGDFKFGWRMRFQARFRDWHTSEMGWRPQLIWRNKVSVSYKGIDHITPYINIELFTRLNDLGEKIYSQQIRYYLGADYEISKEVEVGLFYMHQREFNCKNPEFNHVIGLNLNFSL
ncbi:MAG: DUF2490 domain-containing protein [Flavobacteriales bacterium]|nr:DUF2490 domain-containing protein [Flavobacteriales bacterium]